MNSLSTSSTLSRTNLRVEARRERARRSLLAFTQYTYPHYVADPFHRLLGDALDQVVAGKIRQLMIFAPPQSGKSQLASVHLPAYWLGRYPNKSVIITSYAAELAKSKSRESRTIVEAQPGAYDVFADVFPNVQTARDSRSVNLWQLAQPNRGQLVAAGVDGAITGQGAHLAIIDDPFQTWAEAQSPMTRNHADDWYKGTFRTRVREGGAILLITTRWHPDDLAGRLIGREGDQWTVLRLPAIAETQEERDLNNKFLGLPTGEADPLGRAAGEPLSPSRYSLTALNEIRAAVGSMVWTAAYQGVPRLAEGNRFKRAWFGGIVEAAPVGLTLARYWDKAGTHSSDPGRAGAATAGVLMGKGGDGLIYILNVVQGWYSALERESVIKQTAQLDAERCLNNDPAE